MEFGSRKHRATQVSGAWRKLFPLGSRRTWMAFVGLALALLPAMPSLAGWRDDMKTFRVGMVARGDGQAVPGLSELKRAYSLALGLPVEIFVARDYAALIDAQATGRVDYAIYSTTAYATAQLLCSCVEPIAAPVGDDGATGLVAVLITRDDGLASLAGISGRRVAVAPEGSMAGAVLPAFELAGQDAAFTEAAPFLQRAESASAAEAMFVDGSVDAIFGWAPDPVESNPSGGTLARLLAAGLDSTSLKAVWRSQPLRFGPHALRADLDIELRTILVRFLTRLKVEQPGIYDLLETDHGGGFVEVGPQDYANAVEMIRRAATPATPR